MMSGLSTLFGGCEVVIDADFPDREPELVVFSVVTRGEEIVVEVRETQDIRSSTRVWDQISDASVEIWQGAERLARDVEFPYRMDWPLDVSTDLPLTLKVERPGTNSVIANASIPVDADLELVSLSSVPEGSRGGEIGPVRTTTARLRLRDPAGVENFFVLIRRPARDQVSVVLDDSFELSDAPFRETQFDSEEFVTQLLFTDSSFEDGVVNFSIRYTAAVGQLDVFHLYSVSESYYEYFRTRDLHFDTVDNPFAEPSPIYTNVEGGHGVFAVVGDTSSVSAITPDS